MVNNKPRIVYDSECYRNYWLAKFMDPLTRRVLYEFPTWPGSRPLDIPGLRWVMQNHVVVTFNGNHYDVPMTAAALCGHDNSTLKELSDAIIRRNIRAWEFYELFDIPEIYDLNHIDLIEVAPGVKISLKMYGGRMHSRTMQDLPYPPETLITPFQRVELSAYCENDLNLTADLLRECDKRLDLRAEIGKEYGIDVMSKSDPQISEAVIKSKLDFKPYKAIIQHGTTFRYVAPSYITFKTQKLRDVLQLVQSVDFTVNDTAQLSGGDDDEFYDANGSKVKTGVKMPIEIKKLIITVSGTAYKMGMGGLHSMESKQWFRSIPGVQSISDHDVASYYPFLIWLMKMFPSAIGEIFIPIFKGIIDTRIAAKIAKLITKANGLKIVANGAFGKLFSKYSILFAPELGVRTTMSGQLSLLMLIELLELSGIRVLSANTDGIVLLTPGGLESMRDATMRHWERMTGLQMEATFYTAIYSRDVNNYIAFKPSGEVKRKGVFAESGVSPDGSPQGKHPHKDICADAVIAYLGRGVPIEDTITQCTDIRKFICVRNVKGGGELLVYPTMPEFDTKADFVRQMGMVLAENGRHWRYPIEDDTHAVTLGVAYKKVADKYKFDNAQKTYLGKAVRWYYGRVAPSAIHAKGSGNKVADTDGAVPCMTLPDTLPDNIDYQHYIDDAREMLQTLGL